GLGELTLSGNNTYVGTTVVSAGVLEANSGGALGGSVGNGIAGGTIVNSGATLNVGAGITGEQITLNGTGFGVLPSGNLLLPRGALVATANNPTLTGNIILNTPDATIDALAGQTLTINGNIGVSGTGSGLTKVGTGTLTLTAANTFPGSLTVNAGQVTLTNGN